MNFANRISDESRCLVQTLSFFQHSIQWIGAHFNEFLFYNWTNVNDVARCSLLFLSSDNQDRQMRLVAITLRFSFYFYGISWSLSIDLYRLSLSIDWLRDEITSDLLFFLFIFIEIQHIERFFQQIHTCATFSLVNEQVFFARGVNWQTIEDFLYAHCVVSLPLRLTLVRFVQSLEYLYIDICSCVFVKKKLK